MKNDSGGLMNHFEKFGNRLKNQRNGVEGWGNDFDGLKNGFLA
jgi:hypothetical protein